MKKRPPHSPPDLEVAAKLLQLWKLPRADQPQAFAAWLESAGTPKLIADRARKVKQVSVLTIDTAGAC